MHSIVTTHSKYILEFVSHKQELRICEDHTIGIILHVATQVDKLQCNYGILDFCLFKILHIEAGYGIFGFALLKSFSCFTRLVLHKFSFSSKMMDFKLQKAYFWKLLQ